MAQKRVSVRLVAEGGRQVKAEFQGVGDAGESNFKRIERQPIVPSVRLETERPELPSLRYCMISSSCQMRNNAKAQCSRCFSQLNGGTTNRLDR